MAKKNGNGAHAQDQWVQLMQAVLEMREGVAALGKKTDKVVKALGKFGASTNRRLDALEKQVAALQQK